MEDRVKDRESNIELLRIVCMLMIVFGHMMSHGGIFENGLINKLNLFVGGAIRPGGKIALCCFIVISAWYNTNGNFKAAKFMKIWLQVLFFNILMMLLFSVFSGDQIEPVSVGNWLGCFFPIFGNSHGFAASYLLFLLLLPLAQVVSGVLSKKNLQAITILLTLIQTFGRFLPKLIGFERGVQFPNEMNTFFVIYFIAVYLKKYPLSIITDTWKMIGILTFVWLFDMGYNILWIYHKESEILTSAGRIINDESSPFNMIAGFALFFLFKDMRVRHSLLVNKVASHTFGVLLFHDHNYFRYVLWLGIVNTRSWMNDLAISFIGHMLIAAICVFISGILIDIGRQKIFEDPFIKSSLWRKITGWLQPYFEIRHSILPGGG